jgi:hypothetical protein
MTLRFVQKVYLKLHVIVLMVDMLNVIALSVIILRVIMLNVITPSGIILRVLIVNVAMLSVSINDCL